MTMNAPFIYLSFPSGFNLFIVHFSARSPQRSRVRHMQYLQGSAIPERGTKENLIRGGSALRFDPLPFYIPLLAEKIPLSYTFH